MKIEKVNENQVKFLLTNEDLKEREIKITELAHGSEKAQSFFREIMAEAMIDCGFDAGTTPLMIEAMPVASDSVMIIVSKVLKDSESISGDVSLVPKSLEERKFKQQGIKIIKNTVEGIEEENVYIYSFKNLDDIINLSARLCEEYQGKNMLYKYEDKYFLSIQKGISLSDNLDSVLSEYGQKHTSTIISKYHLSEHGEVIIKDDALSVLASI